MNLIAKLGLDGTGFEAGLMRATKHADAAGASMAKSIGHQFKKIGLAFLGIGALNKFVSETKRWASDIQAVRDEYEKLGIVLDDRMVASMEKMGKEIAKLEIQGKRMFLSLIDGAIGLDSAIGKGAKDSIVEAMRRRGVPERVIRAGLLGVDLEEGAVRTGEWQGPVQQSEKARAARRISVQAMESDQLGRIGGAVGSPNNRSYQVLREQLAQLRKIEENTKHTTTLEM